MSLSTGTNTAGTENRGTYGIGNQALAKDDFAAAEKIDGDHLKGYGQVAEGEVGADQAADEVVDALTPHESAQ